MGSLSAPSFPLGSKAFVLLRVERGKEKLVCINTVKFTSATDIIKQTGQIYKPWCWKDGQGD